MLQTMHEGDNDGTQVQGDVPTFVGATQKLFQDKGYQVETDPNPRGPGGSSVGQKITAVKTDQVSQADMAKNAVGNLVIGALGVKGTQVRASSSIVYTVLINKAWDTTTWDKEVPGRCVITLAGAMYDTDTDGNQYDQQAVNDVDSNAMLSAILKAGGVQGPLPSDPLAYGKMLESQGRDDDAIEVFNKAIIADDQNVFLWRALGDLYYRLGRKDDAVQTYEHVVELRPQDTAFSNWFQAYKARP